VRDMLEDADDMAVVEGIIRFARAFDRQLVAEGVQNSTLGLLLLAMGCDIAQCYGIAPPMAPESVVGWCHRFRPDPEWAEAARWSAQDLPFIAAELQHRHWVDDVCVWLAHDRAHGAPPLLDSHECSFGRWYDSGGAARMGLDGANWSDVLALHESLHDLVRGLCPTSGDEIDAKVKIADLVRLRDELVRKLRAMRGMAMQGTAASAARAFVAR